MPTDLIATTSELSSGPQQLGVAARPERPDTAPLRIEIAVAIAITVDDSNANFAGSIGLRVSTG